MNRKTMNQLMIIIILVFLTYLLTQNPIGITITDEYLDLLPSLLLLSFSIYGIKNTWGVGRFMAYLMLGLSLAYAEAVLNTLGIVVVDWLTPAFTIAYLQAVTIGLSALTGFILMDK